MKLIIAYVRPERLTAVKQALYTRQIYSMSVTNILGAGRQKGYTETYRGVVSEVNLLKKVRIEIGIKDELEAAALEAVTEGARTGKEGDGVVFVMDVAKGLRIRTGNPVA
ncbi:P-II family nitrogen regulator [Nitratidesulfovibrio sp. HK-II]|jgi:nitrogen regulatory protein P-II 1|uniref:P-II family nitrogen regulator n=1 Tax=Nitratidesulfovibrio sp. HK-II TaxID=2009266 RepID=UPI0002275904|nr:P-II family nitrogen regulator [Nitratidesulfovibrio sp. HK-II]EGY25333.1 nitrogen regulatory P-II family protein [Desulfovibrio sp. A2]GBO97351.1 nitrogen regulatory protein P-II [Nitratidesulfovibrio sp. HK-II]HCG03579.1 P-II family nitrogen regulator [Desulfovibrio sp.]